MSLGLSQSAQALEEGQVQHQFGLEWFRVRDDAGAYEMPFAMPYYGIRAGVADRVELGFRSNVTFTNLGFDLKLQAVDTEALDLAIDPTLQYAWLWGWAQLPVLVGFNLSEAFQIILSGRISHAFPLVDESDPSDLDDFFGSSSTAAGGGLGLYVRVGRRFAIMPEVQAVRGLGGDDPVILSFTLGFAIGDQPGVAPEPERPMVPPTQYGPGPDGYPAPYPGQYPGAAPYPAQHPGQAPGPYPGSQPPPAGAFPPAHPSGEPPPGSSPSTPPGYGPTSPTAPDGATPPADVTPDAQPEDEAVEEEPLRREGAPALTAPRPSSDGSAPR